MWSFRETEQKIKEHDASLAEKANEREVVKRGQVDLDEMTERTLEAIKGGGGTSFDLLSIPRDSSVTKEKMSDDIGGKYTKISKESLQYYMINGVDTSSKVVEGNSLQYKTNTTYGAWGFIVGNSINKIFKVKTIVEKCW